MKPKTEAIPFTKKRLAALPAPKDRPGIFYRDSRIAGLSIRVTATTKTFYFVKWANGRPLQIPLGRFPMMSVEQASNRVKHLLSELAEGRDPQSERRTRREEPTIKNLWEHWLLYAKQHKRTWPEDEAPVQQLPKAACRSEAIGRQEVRRSSPPRQGGPDVQGYGRRGDPHSRRPLRRQPAASARPGHVQ